jgi:hypothetical protein
LILSVDLASRRYRDNGIALLSGSASSAVVELIRPDSLGLSGVPVASQFVAALLRVAESRKARLVLLDGPQGWKGIASPHIHARHCERETLTPGKTGVVGQVKPASWTRMASFSIAMFDEFERAGWPRATSAWVGGRAVMESFPTYAWRSLGHPALPGKAKRVDLSTWQRILEERYLRDLLRNPTHDELQAVVAGLAGLQLVSDGWRGAAVKGVEPYREEGEWREGYIISPRAMDTRLGIDAMPSGREKMHDA